MKQIITLMIGLFVFTSCLAENKFQAKNQLVPVEYQSIESITGLAQQFVIDNMPPDLTIASINTGSRIHQLKLAVCAQNIEAYSLTQFKPRQNMTIGIQCHDPQWKIFVPVKAELFSDLVATQQTILKGQVIENRHVKIEQRKFRSYNKSNIVSLKDVIGKLAKRNIPSGSTLRANQLKISYLIKKKQAVTILASSESFSVRMRGIALNRGHKNDIIKVKNSSSNKVVEAVIIKPGLVRVNF